MSAVIVTGASSGIGRAIALRLGRRGGTVVLAARRADELDAVAAQIEASGGRAVVVPTDVRDQEAVDHLVARAREVTGRIGGLVNNAGVGGRGTVMADDESLTRIVEVNLIAPIRLMRAVIPVMRDQGGGAIVNIGSVAGSIGLHGAYSATKFALRGMNDSVRRELKGTNIGVTLVEPGFIATGTTPPRPTLPGPEIVAAAVERALKRPRRRVVVPGWYRAAIVLNGAFPFVTDRMFAGKVAPRPQKR